MKKYLISTLTLILILAFVLRADDIPRHGLTSHIGGAAALSEFEYQYRFFVNDMHAFSACIAINTVGINIGFPLGFNYTYGQKNQLLVGVRFVPNIVLLSFDEEVEVPFWSHLANFRIGYGREFLLLKQNYTLYAYLSPFMRLGSGKILPWAGLGLAYYF
jgi:opacity protein-like surface antigen